MECLMVLMECPMENLLDHVLNINHMDLMECLTVQCLMVHVMNICLMVQCLMDLMDLWDHMDLMDLWDHMDLMDLWDHMDLMDLWDLISDLLTTMSLIWKQNT
jgi:hypothetical protein